ncbi:MAG: hypothetical protein QM656_10360 [Paracoccaceae bacterium]
MSVLPKPPLPLRLSRVHEAYGPGAIGFAAVAVRTGNGPALWIGEGWQGASPHPDGLAAICDPGQILMARTRSQTDTLAVAEEALRDGAVGLVVIELTHPLDLREGRRLQLAAKAGATTGLCLIPEGMGSPAAETRWSCTPVFDEGGRCGNRTTDSTLMRWEIKKNKSGTIGAWHVRWNRAAHRLDVVSPVGFGPDAAGASG